MSSSETSATVAWLRRTNGDIDGARELLGKHPHSFLPDDIDAGIRLFCADVRDENPHFVGAHMALSDVPEEDRFSVMERVEREEAGAEGGWSGSKLVAYRAAFVLTEKLDNTAVLLRAMTEPTELAIPIGSEAEGFPEDGCPAV